VRWLINLLKSKLHKSDFAFYIKNYDLGSPARSGRPVALLCAVILAVSSRPLRNTQREFGGRFIYV
jgi:hypothetical protein